MARQPLPMIATLAWKAKSRERVTCDMAFQAMLSNVQIQLAHQLDLPNTKRSALLLSKRALKSNVSGSRERRAQVT
jgi:hypothetical protein